MHRTWVLLVVAVIFISVLRHASTAIAQRLANAQPRGILSKDGGKPGIVSNLP